MIRLISKSFGCLRSHFVYDRPKSYFQGVIDSAICRTREYLGNFTRPKKDAIINYRYQHRVPDFVVTNSYWLSSFTRSSCAFFFRTGFIRAITARWTSNSLASAASKEARKRILQGRNVPLFAFAGFVLAKKPSLLTKEEEIEELSFEIRDTFSRLPAHNIDKQSLIPPFSKLKLCDLKIGHLLAKGCNAAVYSACWNDDYTDYKQPEVTKETCDKVIISHSEPEISNGLTHGNFGKPLPVGKLVPFNLAVKQMFNYNAESNACSIWRAMYRETLPSILDFPMSGSFGFHKKKSTLPQHPNIVEMYCSFADEVQLLPDATTSYPQALPVRLIDEGIGRNMTLFLVMKRYHCNLKDYLKAYQPSCRTSILLLCQLLEGLVHLQQHSIVHRDLKTDNILLDLSNGLSDPLLVVTDFGCSLEDLKLFYVTEEIDKGGNFALMAPEVKTAVASPFTVINYSRSDLWTAGAIAYEIFGSPNPFYESSCYPSQPSVYSDKDLPPFPSKAPKAIHKLIRDMLNCDPQKRPSPSYAATVCQLLLLMPSEFLENISWGSKKCFADIVKWVFNLSAETYLRAMLDDSHSCTAEFQLQYTFCRRVVFSELLDAFNYISKA